MRKVFIVFVSLLIHTATYSQQLTLGSALDWSVAEVDKKDIPKIAEVWKTYINSLKSGHPDSVRVDLWQNGSTDMLKYVAQNNVMYKDNGEQITFNIRKLNNEVYEIITLSQYQDMDHAINHIYRVCAIEKDGEFKLINYFDVIKPTLNRYTAGEIEYYYPSDFKLNKKAAKKAAEFVEIFKQTYQITDNNPITYIVANSIDECSSMLGLIFTLYRSEKTYAGRALYPRTLLSAQPNHIHELVHALTMPLYPNMTYFMSEGIATYYGGTSQNSLEYHVANLKKYLAEHNVDFTKPNELYKHLAGEVYIEYILGALVIEYTLKNHSTERVKELLECKNYISVFSKLGVPKEEINNFVHHKLIK